MNRRIIAPGLFLLAAVSAGWWYWHHSRTELASTNRLILYGNIDVRLVNLAFDAEGRIEEMTASEGSGVTKGQRLARLDTRRLELVRDAASAEVATQRARVEELEAGTRPEEIHKLEAEFEAARARAANAKRNYQRIRNLELKELASPQQLDDARTAAEAAEADARAGDAALALARAGARREDIAAAKATLVALEAKLALAERNLAEASLNAPSDGVIQSRILEPGDMASPQRPVYTLALTEPLWARVYVAEPALGKVDPGMPAEVTSDSFPGKKYAGWVGYVSPSAEFTPKSVQTEETRVDLVYQARVFVCNPQGELRLGMPVTVRLDLNGKPRTPPACAEAPQP
jgi:HlyD family secretion protein